MPKPLVEAISLPPAGRACALPLSMAAHVALAGAILVTQALSPVELPKTASLPILGFPTLADPAPPPALRGTPGKGRARGAASVPPARSQPGVVSRVEPSRWTPFVSAPLASEDVEVDLGPACDGCSPDGVPDGVPGGSPGSGGPGVAAPRPVPVGGDVRPPTKVRHVNPIYPEIAKAAHVQGDVVLECVIDADGTVTDIRVVRGHPLLDAAAVAAVQQWLYEPTQLNGRAVAVLMTVTVEFRIAR
jgi:periplasmic protein TonB